MLNLKNIGIIGVGGVGGYFGGKLCQLQREVNSVNVSFLARGEHLRAIQNSGLRLDSEHDGSLICKPSLATDDFRRLPPLDLCLICVKEFDLSAALNGLKPAISRETIVLPLLNGVDVVSRVRKVIDQGIVLPACVYVGTHIECPGKVVQKGGACKILYGPDPLRPSFAPEQVLQLFDQAKIKCEWTLNIQSELWKKFIFICAYGLVSAAYGKTLGEILQDAALTDDVQSIMVEAIALAKRSGVSLPDNIAEVSLAKGRTFPPDAKTSFQRDFERMDKRDERDLFAGAMLRIAGELGIAVPRTELLSAILAKKKPLTSSQVRVEPGGKTERRDQAEQ